MSHPTTIKRLELEQKRQLLQAAPPRRVIPAWEPMPLDALPIPIRCLAEQASAAMFCDPAYIVMPCLGICAGAIGNTRSLRLKSTWNEPCVLWSVVVAESGTQKSPTYQLAMQPLYDLEQRWRAEHAAELVAWAEQSEEMEMPPPRPVLRRGYVSDVTVEKLAQILLENPRGTQMDQDELRSWFASFTRYKSGGGSDIGNWLSSYNAGTIQYDRKTGDNRQVFVPRGAVSVTGNIQPTTLARVMSEDMYECGLAARLMMAMPPKRRKRWTTDEVDQEVLDGYSATVERLFGLGMFTVGEGVRRRQVPHRLRLDRAAEECWVAWYNDWAEEQYNASGSEASAKAKIEAVAARLALIHHVVSCAFVESDDNRPIGLESMEAGVKLARWFSRESERVYAILHESDEARDQRRLIEWLGQRPERKATAREVQKSNPRLYPTAEQANLALEELAAFGMGEFRDVTHDGRGRPTREFTLADLTEKPCDTIDTIDTIPAPDSGHESPVEAAATQFDGAAENLPF
jgi:hypothetical protein